MILVSLIWLKKCKITGGENTWKHSCGEYIQTSFNKIKKSLFKLTGKDNLF